MAELHLLGEAWLQREEHFLKTLRATGCQLNRARALGQDPGKAGGGLCGNKLSALRWELPEERGPLKTTPGVRGASGPELSGQGG